MSVQNLRRWVGMCALVTPLLAPLPAVFADCNPFKRADANADGQVDIADAIRTLLFLFIEGTSEPLCVEAADANGSGDVDLSDAVFTLQFLFRGSDPPPAPGPAQCGRSPLGSTVLTCFEYPACGVSLEKVDFSGFEQFDFQISGALGFCASIGELFSASIRRRGDDPMIVSLSILEEGAAGAPDCIEGFFDDSGERKCAVPVTLPARQLSEGEAAALTAVFRRIRVFRAPDPICECIAIDPCLITNFSWDGERFSDFTCSADRLGNGLGQEIVELLESLR